MMRPPLAVAVVASMVVVIPPSRPGAPTQAEDLLPPTWPEVKHWTDELATSPLYGVPVVAVMVLFYGVYHWNAYFNAMIYLRTRELYPLQLVLREVLISNSTQSMTTGVSTRDAMPIGETIKYAVIVVATAPILCIYPFLQRYFVKGVLIGALKE